MSSGNDLDSGYTDIRQATTMPGLPDSAYRVKAAQDRDGQTQFFVKGERVSKSEGFALSTGLERSNTMGVFSGVDIGPDGKIRR